MSNINKGRLASHRSVPSDGKSALGLSRPGSGISVTSMRCMSGDVRGVDGAKMMNLNRSFGEKPTYDNTPRGGSLNSPPPGAPQGGTPKRPAPPAGSNPAQHAGKPTGRS